MNFNYTPYYPPQYNPQMQRLQQVEQQYPQFTQQNPVSYPQNPQTYPQTSLGLQGKLIDNADIAKIMDIPLDGSITYFPLTDGSAIITKQLQQDGTSKTIVYKPVQEPSEPVQVPKYVTEEQILEMLETEPDRFLELKEEIKELKRQLRDVNEDMKELKKSKRKSDE